MPRFKRQLPPKWLLFAVCLTVVVILIGLYTLKGDNKPPIAQQSEAITYSTDTPDESKPTDDYKWSGKGSEPKRINLPSIETNGYIQKVGVDQNKQVAVPSNIHFAGWFVDSVLPGEKGLSIIDGHVDGRQATGIFKQLEKLKENDTYQIEFGNGVSKSFQVKRVAALDTKDAANELFSQDPQIVRQVNLITCGGSFNKQTQQYDKRVIVVSEFIE